MTRSMSGVMLYLMSRSEMSVEDVWAEFLAVNSKAGVHSVKFKTSIC